MSVVALLHRAPILRSSALSRTMHSSSPARSAHGDYHVCFQRLRLAQGLISCSASAFCMAPFESRIRRKALHIFGTGDSRQWNSSTFLALTLADRDSPCLSSLARIKSKFNCNHMFICLQYIRSKSSGSAA